MAEFLEPNELGVKHWEIIAKARNVSVGTALQLYNLNHRYFMKKDDLASRKVLDHLHELFAIERLRGKL
jgi:hypothetical protein